MRKFCYVCAIFILPISILICGTILTYHNPEKINEIGEGLVAPALISLVGGLICLNIDPYLTR